ncbi:helix-turn-helix transcriptional regulator [Nocardioides mangrovi]|uniref:Helix-turn-helix transcriptional regulator n=1 Tax=Nocardioides mangrovi TaxID=2874580 RepID=A0ABS7UCH1_9ACTN|nr:helix-turn-helix transcriptional regulator [Nocardioides mangrovi]MBZ5738327.1 helix-turn-helix transcriptional regulator [Nocardioides mangrovi]
MARAERDTVLTALGFDRATAQLYEGMLPQSGRELGWVAAAVLRTPDELVAEMAPLVERGIVRLQQGRVYVEGPAQALARLIDEQGAAVATVQERLAALATAVPLVAGGGAKPAEGEVVDVRPLDGEVSSGGQPATLIGALIAQSSGDLLWLRPDQWRIDREPEMLRIIRDLVASGRRSLAIYPLRVMADAPDVVRRRAEAGEEIRLLPDLPTRMFVIGSTHAVVPEPLGYVDEPRLLVRQGAVVGVMRLWFEELWGRAAVPALDGAEPQVDLRRFLLEQLATGARDEQIARKLGISLRTVRRRVADLMTELGADSRFQAGIEAARRGWI